jgi:TRAP-type mannitol/chloroaromatic compound transport system permease small subunit
VLYARWSDKTKAWINLIGALVFIVPFSYLIWKFGQAYAIESFSMGETSADPGGLPHRWIIKSIIPISAVFTGIAGLNMATQALRVMSGEKTYEAKHGAEGLA